MTRTRKIKLKNDDAEIRYANWLKMVIDLIAPQNLYLFAGRALGKTSDILAERSQDIVYDLPGAPFAFVGDTYMNLQKNVIHSFLQGWKRKGWQEGIHYVVDKEPPAHFKQPYNRLLTYKHTISMFNGCNFTLISMDRPSIGAGNSFIHLFGDEVKYLKKEKLNKLTPAIRGDYIRFGDSPYYLGRTFTSDLANPWHNEDEWMLEMEDVMDIEKIKLILDTAFIVNDIRKEYYEAVQSNNEKQLANVSRKLKRWNERLIKIRKKSTFFHIASSFVNADILREDYFDAVLESLGLTEYKTSVLSMKASLDIGELFYGNLADKHFYSDGYNYNYYDQFNLQDDIIETSAGLKHIRPNEILEAGYDAGNMMSLVVGQEQWPYYRIVKGLYTLTPEWISELANKFTEFFASHKKKVLHLYYDRAANQYSKSKQDFATKLKNAIEKKQLPSGSFQRTGWKVELKSIGQANIEHSEEFDLMNDIMGEKDNRLPKLLIDQFECKELKSSLELAPVEKARGRIRKVKKSEKLPVKRLPMESTNFSDAFKYLMCRKRWLDISKQRQAIYLGDIKLR